MIKYSDWNNIPIEICIQCTLWKNISEKFLRQIGRESEKELDGNEMDNNMTIFNISCIRIVFAGDKNIVVLYICLWKVSAI